MREGNSKKNRSMTFKKTSNKKKDALETLKSYNKYTKIIFLYKTRNACVDLNLTFDG